MSPLANVRCRLWLSGGLVLLSAAHIPTRGGEARVKEPWDYPPSASGIGLRPLSPDEARRECQIPADSAKELSTPALLDLCLRHPYLIHVILFNRPDEGVEDVIASFRGFEELFHRQDFGAAVLAHYTTRVREARRNGEPWHVVELVFLHTLLAQSRCLALLNPLEKSALASQSLRCLLANRDSHRTKSASDSFVAHLFCRLMSSPGVVLKTSLREYTAASLPAELRPPVLEGAPVGTRSMEALISLARREVGNEDL